MQSCPLEVTAYVRSSIEGDAHPFCICLAVATKQYTAKEVLDVVRTAGSEPVKPRRSQDTILNSFSL